MAHYVQIPKDLNEIKQKFMFGLTKRQVVCFGIGFAIGIPMFFITKGSLGLSGGIVVMGICAAPAIVCGVYKKNGVYFEQHIKFMFRYFKRPRLRIFRPVSMFDCIMRKIEYNKLRKLLIQAEGGKR